MAILEKGKAKSGLPRQEVIRCPHDGCEMFYTLSYTDAENRIVGSENDVDKMKRMAADIIKNEHPPHFINNYLWKAIGTGPECHWVEADSVAARKAL
jgi:hypothetical protein